MAFGACFSSGSKPNAVNAPLALFAQAKNKISIPLVAIGGITLANAPQVVKAGADALAVIAALFDSAEITKTSQQFVQMFHADDR